MTARESIPDAMGSPMGKVLSDAEAQREAAGFKIAYEDLRQWVAEAEKLTKRFGVFLQALGHPRRLGELGGDVAQVLMVFVRDVEAHGLGLFVRSLVGLDREAAKEAGEERAWPETVKLGQYHRPMCDGLVDH